MRILARYAILLLGILLALWLIISSPDDNEEESSPPSYWSEEGEKSRSSRQYGDLPCSFHSCFNFSRCDAGRRLKVFVYPSLDGDIVSPSYMRILQAIRQSAYYTPNSHDACLFVLSVDTINRDKLSPDYVRDVNELIDNLPSEIWNGGMNHVIFNLYHGTYPDYADHNLGFNTGKAIIARASPSVQHFRFGFDVSFPLFHPTHGLRVTAEVSTMRCLKGRFQRMYEVRSTDSHLVSFKGKRYVYGIGSETRDALHYLHNGEVVPMVTTCKHNNDWKEHQDDRCERDNAEYEKWEYFTMMANSTFCLAPRGRRLGSFRFLESLKMGCIPVVLSDDWVLPFDEVIDWSQAAVVMAEDNVLLVPGILADISPVQVLRMKERGRFLYNRYFRDVESITLSSLRIIFDRVRRSENKPTRQWMEKRVKESSSEGQEPQKANVLIQASVKPSKSLQAVFKTLAQATSSIDKVFVIWPSERGVPPLGADFGTSLSVSFINSNESFPYMESIRVFDRLFLFIDEKTSFEAADVDRIFSYLRSQQERIVGLHGVDYDPMTSTLKFSSTYNAVFPSVLGFNGSYMETLLEQFPSSLLSSCPMIAVNILISDLSMQPPLIIGHHQPQQYMHNSKNLECWKQVTSRWDFIPPLHYSSLHFA